MQDKLQGLIKEHGNEKVLQAAKQLLETELQKRAGQYHELVTPEKIADDLQFVNHALNDLEETGQAVQDAYADRSELVKQITQLETSIELDEAEAFMMLEGNKVMVDGEKLVTLSNDKMRDAYRKHVTRDARTKLAELQSDLKAIEIEIYKTKEQQDTAKQSADLIKSRLYVTANLLNFLS